jgi:hypothetical protein
MIVKKIFEKVFDEEVHSDFLKFGKGEFRSKYLVDAKKQKDKWVIKTSPEYANYFVKRGLEKISGKIKITGCIVSTMALDLPFQTTIKQFMGVKQFQVAQELEPKQILDAMNKYPRAFFALSFVLPDYELKIKAKAPKSAKPSTAGEKEIKPEFCSLKTTDANFIRELFFDFPIFNEISVKHTVKIDSMVYPNDMAKMKPEEIREKSKRKGILIREVTVDGRVEKKEANFEA